MTGLRKRVSIDPNETPKTKQASSADPSTCIGSTFVSSHSVKHGLIEKPLPIPDAYEMFLKVGADPEVEKLRRKVAHGSKIKHIPALYRFAT